MDDRHCPRCYARVRGGGNSRVLCPHCAVPVEQDSWDIEVSGHVASESYGAAPTLWDEKEASGAVDFMDNLDFFYSGGRGRSITRQRNVDSTSPDGNT